MVEMKRRPSALPPNHEGGQACNADDESKEDKVVVDQTGAVGVIIVGPGGGARSCIAGLARIHWGRWARSRGGHGV